MRARQTLATALGVFLFCASVAAQQGPPDVQPRVDILEGRGINPLCFAGDPPVIGTLWNSAVDGSQAPGAEAAIMVLSTADLEFGYVTDLGELLINPFQRFVTLARPIREGLARFAVPVPNELSLLGERYFAQALAIGPDIRTLCNGLRLTVGSPPQNLGARQR